VCEQPGRAMLPAERDALWIHVLVEEEARRRIPGKRHLAEGELPVLARAPFRVGEVQIERLARIDVRERLVRRARIEALRSRRLDLDSQSLVHARREAGAEPDAVAVALLGEIPVDGFIPVPQIAFPLEAPDPLRQRLRRLRSRRRSRARVRCGRRRRLLLPLELLDSRLQGGDLCLELCELRRALRRRCGSQRDERECCRETGRGSRGSHGSFLPVQSLRGAKARAWARTLLRSASSGAI